jgi:hypothetical protein
MNKHTATATGDQPESRFSGYNYPRSSELPQGM